MVEDEKELLPTQSESTTVLPSQDEYCINLLWLSDDYDIRPTAEDVKLITSQCIKWREYNENVYLWTNCISKFAHLITDSKIFVENINKLTRYGFDIKTNTDIREILYDKKIQIFLRIDFLKNLILHNQTVHNEFKYVLFTDMDINIYLSDNKTECSNTGLDDESKLDNKRFFTRDFIFNDDKTKQKLDFYGMVVAYRTAPPYFENSYIIFKNIPANEYLIELIFVKLFIIYVDTHKDLYEWKGLEKPHGGILLYWYKIHQLFLLIYTGKFTYDYEYYLENSTGDGSDCVKNTVDKKLIENTDIIIPILSSMLDIHLSHYVHEVSLKNIKNMTVNEAFPLIMTQSRNNYRVFVNLPTKRLISGISKLEQHTIS